MNTPANHEWKSSLRYDFTPFQALETKSYKNDPYGVFFRIRSDSLNMNNTAFSFSWLVKLNIERPILGTNPSSLRFEKHMSLDLSFDKIYQVFVTLFELVKLKRGTYQSSWGKWEGNHFCKKNGSSLSLPLNMALVCISFHSIGYSWWSPSHLLTVHIIDR